MVHLDSNIIQREFSQLSQYWSQKGSVIINDSRPTLIRLRLRGNVLVTQQSITANEFLSAVTSTIDLPMYDSNGDVSGHTTREILRSIDAMVVSSCSSLSGTTGFRFRSDAEHPTDQQDLYFIHLNDLSVLKNAKMRLFAQLVGSTAFTNPDVPTLDYLGTRKRTEKLAFFPLTGNASDSTATISMVRLLLQQYQEDFVQTHYLKNILSYQLVTDTYYNEEMQPTKALYDTILLEDPASPGITREQVQRWLSPSLHLGISLYLHWTPNASHGLQYAGIQYPLYTKSGIYLGDSDLFLDRPEREKHFRPSSRLLEQFMLSLYQ